MPGIDMISFVPTILAEVIFREKLENFAWSLFLLIHFYHIKEARTLARELFIWKNVFDQ